MKFFLIDLLEKNKHKRKQSQLYQASLKIIDKILPPVINKKIIENKIEIKNKKKENRLVLFLKRSLKLNIVFTTIVSFYIYMIFKTLLLIWADFYNSELYLILLTEKYNLYQHLSLLVIIPYFIINYFTSKKKRNDLKEVEYVINKDKLLDKEIYKESLLIIKELEEIEVSHPQYAQNISYIKKHLTDHLYKSAKEERSYIEYKKEEEIYTQVYEESIEEKNRTEKEELKKINSNMEITDNLKLDFIRSKI